MASAEAVPSELGEAVTWQVGRLCRAIACGKASTPVPLSSSGGVTTANDVTKAPPNLGKVVYFQVTQKKRAPTGVLVLQFKCDRQINLHFRAFEPESADGTSQPSTAPWQHASRAITSGAEPGEYTRDFSALVAGLVYNGEGYVAVYLQPGEELEWSLHSQQSPSHVELRVVELVNVRELHDQSIDCLTLANEYESAVTLFEHNHTVGYEEFLEEQRRVLETERAMNISKLQSNSAVLNALQHQAKELQNTLRLATAQAEAAGRAASMQKHDEDLMVKLTELRADMATKREEACSKRRSELEAEAMSKRDAAEAAASAEHEAQLKELKAKHAARLAELKAEAAEVERQTMVARQALAQLQPAHDARVEMMEADSAAQTQALLAQSEKDIADDVEAYVKRRSAEATTIADEVAAINEETQLFRTFYLVASGGD